MIAFIPLEDTIKDFQKLLRNSALTGIIDVSPTALIQQLRREPIYDIDYIIDKVKAALAAPDPDTNCITGDDTEHVVVTNEKLNEVLSIIRHGGMSDEQYDEQL